jgi:hypothetical protein
MTSAQDRAETYLRLRAEAELRRVAALPRPEPFTAVVLPAPLRDAARLVTPFARRALAALQPLADNAARTLQPLAEGAEQAVTPLAQSALAALQPVAQNAARTLEPLAGRVIGTVLPAADQAARRLHPLAWQAAGRLQTLQQSGARQLLEWRWHTHRAAASFRGTADHPGPGHEEPTPEEGLGRLRLVARALADAGAIDPRAADSVVEDLELALAARAWINPHMLFTREMRGPGARHQAGPPAGPYLAVPAGTLVPVSPESGLADVRLFTLVIAPDRAVLTVAGRLSDQNMEALHLDPWPLFGKSMPTAVDDRGNGYQLHEDSGFSDDENWGGILRLAPIPAAGTRWLDLTLSPGSAPVRLDLAAAQGAGTGQGSDAASGPAAAASPAGRIIDAAATELLHLAAGDGHALPWHDLSAIADVVTTLDAVGALDDAARAAVRRLVALARRAGAGIPPGLAAAARDGPADLPESWNNVLENRGRRDGPRGVAPAAAVLPELDGARFVLAGLRSDEGGAFLHVMAWGTRVVPHYLDGAMRSWFWLARDDRGRWHVAEDGNSSASDQHAEMTLRLIPPLHPEATSLEVTVTGRSGEVTATVPLDWRGSDD